MYFKKILTILVVCGLNTSVAYAQEKTATAESKPVNATTQQKTAQNQTGAKRQRPAIVVTVEAVKEITSMPTTDITGALYFTNKADVASERASKVAKVYVDEGDIVKKGDPLVQLDDDTISLELEVAIAKADTAKHDRDFAKNTLDRNELLYKNKSISEQVYDNYKTTYNKAVASYSSAINEVNILQRAKDKMLIRSPLDGVVTSTSVYEGEWVTAGGTVANVSALEFEVRVNLPERLLEFVGEGDGLYVVTSVGTIKPEIVAINHKGDITTNTFPATLVVGANDEFREGMKATVKVPSGKAVKALYVPLDSVVDKNGAKGVYVVGQNNMTMLVPVEVIGYQGDGMMISSKGLKAGQKVVVSGTNLIGNGSVVKISGN